MTSRAPHNATPSIFLSADWSKHAEKRSVHVADLTERRIWHPEEAAWNLEALLDLARSLTDRGPVLVGLDLALGVPSGYWAAAKRQPKWETVGNFAAWLKTLDPDSQFFRAVRDPDAWRVDRPFFHVPAGKGGLGSFQDRVEGGLLRRVDASTGAKPIFAVSGFRGTVGSGTRALWLELVPHLLAERDFAIWPFEGSLSSLWKKKPIVLAETYPGLAYAAALSPTLPARRLIVSKTKRKVRAVVCDQLADSPWIEAHDVDLGDLAPARADEDAFDSHLTAAAVLRCALDGLPLAEDDWIDPIAEGSMLLAGPVDPGLRAVRGTSGRFARTRPRDERQIPLTLDAADRPRQYSCPIPGCDKVFRGTRGGWDSHVASLRQHPAWHPEIGDATGRKEAFRREFPNWFTNPR